jgi:hypothetical protein
MTSNIKPGYLTTEFWLTVAAATVGLLLGSGFFPSDGPIVQALGIVAAGLASLGYSFSRAKTKHALAWLDIPQEKPPLPPPNLSPNTLLERFLAILEQYLPEMLKQQPFFGSPMQPVGPNPWVMGDGPVLFNFATCRVWALEQLSRIKDVTDPKIVEAIKTLSIGKQQELLHDVIERLIDLKLKVAEAEVGVQNIVNVLWSTLLLHLPEQALAMPAEERYKQSKQWQEALEAPFEATNQST